MQTPAPKRRFLRDQPSSSSSTPQKQQPSSAKTPFRFVGTTPTPSSTQHTRFRTPGATGASEYDGIDTSFEDDGSQGQFEPAVTQRSGTRDEEQQEYGIEDEDEEDHVTADRTGERHRLFRDQGETDDQHDAVSLRKDDPTSTRKGARPHETIVSDPRPSKRPKRTVSNKLRKEEVSSASSASEDDDLLLYHHTAGKKKGIDVPPARSDHPLRERIDNSSGEDEEYLSPTLRSPTTKPNNPTSHPPPLAATRPTTRRFLKPPNKLTGSGSSELLPLPEAFSPSRRRGRHEYIPGGAAATVRSWILGLAAVETPDSLNQGQLITVKSLVSDKGGRCVRVVDETGKEWVLISQQPSRAWRSRGRAETDIERLQEGCVVKIKGTATRWAIPGFGFKRIGGEGAAEGEAEDLNVAALWEIVPG